MLSREFSVAKHISLLTWLLFFSYLFLLSFFEFVDVYHHYFFSAGVINIVYNAYRVYFIFCLLWLFYITGDWFLTFVSNRDGSSVSSLEFSTLSFFSGLGIWQIFLFAIGLLGLYSRHFFEATTILIFFMSLPKLDDYVCRLTSKSVEINWLGLGLLVIPLTLFLMTKGLYPAGGHDYYNHYFPFYRAVTDSGSILPNEVWYQFYYSKGAGLFFLSMLLTDPLAPQLASTAMIFAGAAIVFLMLRNASSMRLLPWAAVALYITFLIYTPGPYENMQHGGWADLEKTHEPVSVLILAIVWLVARLSQIQTTHARWWGAALLFTLTTAVLISTVIAILVGAYLSSCWLYFIWRKKYTAAFWVGCGVATAAFWLAVIWGINYFFTGMLDDQSLLVLWPMINLTTIKKLGLSFEVFIANWAKTGQVANKVPLTTDIIRKISTYLRLDVWCLLLVISAILFGMSLCFQKWRKALLNKLSTPELFATGSFLIFMIVFSLFLGRDQPISFYRFSSFTYAPMLCFCFLLLGCVLRRELFLISILFIVVLGFPINWVLTSPKELVVDGYIHTMYAQGQQFRGLTQQILHNAYRFAKGKYSIADAYKNQNGWPGRMPWGGIYPAAETIWKLLPSKTRIWSMHIHSYCMLPDCHMEGYMSFRLSPHAEEIYYGDPRIAKNWLKKEKLNYFFYSHELQLTDPLPLTPLFSPEHIAQYLGIAWTDGENTLLTWKEDALLPINKKWLRRYKEKVEASKALQAFPYQSLQVVFNLAKNHDKVVATSIPWYRAGWK